jgi:hypothetical protein
MNADPEVTRIVRSWLRTDEHESADRVLSNVLAVLDATPQRRPLWPVRRIAQMNGYAKLAAAIAAVVVVAVVGFNLLPASGGVAATPSPSPSPSPSPTPTPSPTPSPTPVAFAFPENTDLAAGTRYQWLVDGVPLSLAVPGDGWSTKGAPFGTINRDGGSGPNGTLAGSWLLIWDVENVNVNPCSTRVLSPEPGPSAADLAAAIAGMPGVEVVEAPSEVTVGGLPAQRLVVALPDDLGCAPESDDLWYQSNSPACGGDTGPCWRYASEPGETIDLWIVDADGGRVVIEAETYKATQVGIKDEIQQIVDSVQFD